MKEKIKVALQQAYKNLGLSDEVFERVATTGETFIKDEQGIDNFVKGAESMLKLFQSEGDKTRTALKRIEELEEQAKKTEQTPPTPPQPPKEDEPKPQPKTQEELITSLVEKLTAKSDEKFEKLLNEFTSYKTQQMAKESIVTAKAKFQDNGYVKKYSEQADDAWDRAIEVYELGGSKMTAEELSEKAMSYFTKAVSRKGVDTSKPFVGEDQHKEELDVSTFTESLKRTGRIQEDKKE
jgi:hypothetical protein